MKLQMVTIKLFQKGDKVLTPDGKGEIAEDEKLALEPDGTYDSAFRMIPVRYLEASSNIQVGQIKEIDRYNCILEPESFPAGWRKNGVT